MRHRYPDQPTGRGMNRQNANETKRENTDSFGDQRRYESKHKSSLFKDRDDYVLEVARQYGKFSRRYLLTAAPTIMSKSNIHICGFSDYTCSLNFMYLIVRQ